MLSCVIHRSVRLPECQGVSAPSTQSFHVLAEPLPSPCVFGRSGSRSGLWIEPALAAGMYVFSNARWNLTDSYCFILQSIWLASSLSLMLHGLPILSTTSIVVIPRTTS